MTVVTGRAGPLTVPSAGSVPVHGHIDRVSLVGLQALVVTLVVFQRFVVPGTIVSVALPVALAVAALLCLRGTLRLDPVRGALYLLAVGACLSATLVTSVSGRSFSATSYLLLVVLYVPLCLCLTPAARTCLPHILRLLQRLLTLAAAACVLQWLAQSAGWQYRDLLSVLPPQFLASTDEFNLSYPIYYGSLIYKSNGVVFLEPSFASQFLALGIIVQLLVHGSRWRLALFVAALGTTVSGTGLLLLAVGLAVLALRRGGRWAVMMVIAAGAVALLASLTPIGPLIVGRSTETAVEGSSGNARFVAPHIHVTQALRSDDAAMLVGRGPGSVTRDADFFNRDDVPANYPAFAKVVAEYGLPAGLIFVAFIVTVFFRGAPSPTLAIASTLLFFVLSSALLQPPIVYVCWLLTGLFANDWSDRSRNGRVAFAPER